MKPIISVIIPIFNSGSKAVLAYKSVCNQKTVYNFEVIFIDDCSSDHSLTFIENSIQAQDNIILKFLRHNKNQGAGAARNTGIKNSTGDYIAFLDSDDLWLPHKTEKQMEYLLKFKGIGLIGSLTNMPGSINPPYKRKSDFVLITGFDLCFKNYFQTSTVILNSEIFKKHFSWSKMRYGDEGDAFIRTSFVAKAILLNEVLVDYSCGKMGFGVSGVSSNLKGMQTAEIKNLKMAYKYHKNITVLFTSLVFSYLKYFVRIFRTKIIL